MIAVLKKKIIDFIFCIVKERLEQEKDSELLRFKDRFESSGEKLWMGKDFKILNPQFISFGDNFSAGSRFRIEAIDCYQEQNFDPVIKIGSNVSIGTDVHIACINKIIIKDNCLFGSRLLITDHQHGGVSKHSLLIPPARRNLKSKGPVIINENVWIGDGVVIMPGITIGRNAVIGSNSVVTKNVEPYSVVGGIPARQIIHP